MTGYSLIDWIKKDPDNFTLWQRGLIKRRSGLPPGGFCALPPAMAKADGQVGLADAGRTGDVVLTNPVLWSAILGIHCAVMSWKYAVATFEAGRRAPSSSFPTGPGPRSRSG